MGEQHGGVHVTGEDADAVAAILYALEQLRVPNPVVLIDGPSGAGKSTLADAIIASWPSAWATPQLLRMDAIVPGWDGLAASSEMLATLLDELAAGRNAGGRNAAGHHAAGHRAEWTAWDWVMDAPGARGTVVADRPLIVEGSGSLTATTSVLATVAVWVDLADERERFRRAIERDGALYEPHWDRWAAQERAHVLRHDPQSLADFTVDRV